MKYNSFKWSGVPKNIVVSIEKISTKMIWLFSQFILLTIQKRIRVGEANERSVKWQFWLWHHYMTQLKHHKPSICTQVSKNVRFHNRNKRKKHYKINNDRWILIEAVTWRLDVTYTQCFDIIGKCTWNISAAHSVIVAHRLCARIHQSSQQKSLRGHFCVHMNWSLRPWIVLFVIIYCFLFTFFRIFLHYWATLGRCELDCNTFFCVHLQWFLLQCLQKRINLGCDGRRWIIHRAMSWRRRRLTWILPRRKS